MQKKYIVLAVSVFVVGLLLSVMQMRVLRAEEAAHKAQVEAEDLMQVIQFSQNELRHAVERKEAMRRDYEQRLAAHHLPPTEWEPVIRHINMGLGKPCREDIEGYRYQGKFYSVEDAKKEMMR
jgi:hypothetical protein